ncbi:unnamed protein product [Urochloa decumbens]|uniref:AAA+ ATPase domain-containing protein n=1 Tax=Urochloa decumbens TaxID=240449 RepID=A0ABC9DCI0_9POAL
MPGILGALGAPISTVIKPFIDIFIKHATYLFTTSSNVRDLEKPCQSLEAMRNDLQRQIEDGNHRNGEIATDEAKNWLIRVEQAESDVHEIDQRHEQRCRIFGCCSPNCWSNYKISKKAVKTLLEVNQCRVCRPTNVTVKPTLPSVVHIATQSVDLLPSQERFLNEVLQCITEDPGGTIGIWGPGGIGKTVLLKMINNLFFEQMDSASPNSSDRRNIPFDIVIYLTATRECSVQNVQAQIAERLNLNVASRISEFLRGKSFLVLMDDLWERLDLAAVGFPFPLGAQSHLKQKIVIVTRSKPLCDQMDLNKAMEVPGLEENEALQLFKKNVGMENLYSDPCVGALAKNLVQQIRDLPSELITMGKVMRGKEDPRIWEDIIRVVKESIHNRDGALSLTGENVRKLEEAIKNLRGRIDDVRHQIELAKRNNKVATNHINIWLARADTIMSDGKVICVSEQHGLIWDGSVMAADQKLREIKECINDQPSDVAVGVLPPSVQEMPCSSMKQQLSRDVLLQEAMHYIKDDPVEVIGIWGLGGVGKTHLLKGINNSVGSLFDSVIFVTASKECSVGKIQAQIVKQLKLLEDDAVGSQASIISDFLKERSFLVLLDDLWEYIDLDAVGIPFKLENEKRRTRKVVLTTRSRKVCGLMEVRKEIKVDSLEQNEAWQLFEESVGQETLSSSPRVEGLAKELVNELKGLPLALITIGRAMYAKTDPSEWESAIHYMEQSCCDDDDLDLSMEDRVFKRLKFSYDSLRNDTLRNCFLTCSLWPEDKIITMEDLLECWIGRGLVDETDTDISYNKVKNLIGELKASCLLENGKSSYIHGNVKMHDVIRDMAIWISCGCGKNNGKWVVRAGVGANSSRNTIPWSRAECVSLMVNGMVELPSSRCNNPCSTELRALFLQGNKLDERIVGALEAFSALTYLDLRCNSLRKIPEELCALANLVYLNLSENQKINEVPVRIAKLVKLKFLYLQHTSIRLIPEGVISSLEALQVVDLRTGNGFDITAIFGELCTLTNLKAVHADVNGAVQFELLSQSADIPFRCLNIQRIKETSEFCFSGGTYPVGNEWTLRELFLGSVSMKQITLGDGLGKPFDALRFLKLQHLLLLERITWKGVSPPALFPKLTRLNIISCTKLQHISWVMYLPCLQVMSVMGCANMKQVFLSTEKHGVEIHRGEESSKSPVGTFPCLKTLSLSNSVILASLCDSDVTFPSLENLEVSRCPNLKRLPFTMHTLPPKLRNLEFYSFEQWKNMEWGDEGVKSFLEPYIRFSEEIVKNTIGY